MAISQSAYDRLLQTIVTTSRTMATSQLGPRTEAAERRQTNAMNEAERRMSPAQFQQFIRDSVAATTGRNSPRSSTTDYPGADAARERTRARLGTEFGSTVSNPNATEATGMLAEMRRSAASPTQAGTGNS